MDAIELLHTRNSVSALSEPAPDVEQLQQILAAALRAPDHARLRPWRFLSITGGGRQRLGELFVEAAQQRLQAAGEPIMDEAACAKLAAKPLRAPLILVVIATVTEHPKVPAVEQLLSAGCAAHGILLAAHALGFGAIWRTGSNAYDGHVERGLGLASNEQIVGFLYLGTAAAHKPLPAMATEDYCQSWGEDA